MNDSRRNWLKLFGAGALIAPIIGAKPDETNVAQLIEVPKIKPVELFASIPKPIDVSNVKAATILLEMKDGAHHRIGIEPETFGGIIDPSDRAVDIGFLSGNLSPVTSSAWIYGKRL